MIRSTLSPGLVLVTVGTHPDTWNAPTLIIVGFVSGCRECCLWVVQVPALLLLLELALVLLVVLLGIVGC